MRPAEGTSPLGRVHLATLPSYSFVQWGVHGAFLSRSRPRDTVRWEAASVCSGDRVMWGASGRAMVSGVTGSHAPSRDEVTPLLCPLHPMPP